MMFGLFRNGEFLRCHDDLHLLKRTIVDEDFLIAGEYEVFHVDSGIKKNRVWAATVVAPEAYQELLSSLRFVDAALAGTDLLGSSRVVRNAIDHGESAIK